ncbi:MAG: porin [Rhodospirillales bacterium]|nr:porin [Rhodospirillales bacterium]
MTSKTTRMMLLSALIGGSVLFAGMPAFADTTDDLLLKLLHKGILSKSEYNELRKRKSTEAPPPPPVVAVTPVAPPPPPSVAAIPTESGGFVRMMNKGVGLHVGDVDLSFSGEINGFYVNNSPDSPSPRRVVHGGLASVGTNDNSAVRDGLLPGNFNIDLKTVQEGLDIGVHFGFYPGLNNVTGVGGANSPGSPQALGTSGIDFRQQYVTIGRSDIGTFKIGRDIGFFGAEAILNDFTLFGVGTASGNIAPSNTSLGRIGLGYIYADWIPQITYTTPDFAGFTAGIGIFQPFNAANFSGDSAVLSAQNEPQFQAKLAYTMPTDPDALFKAKLWTNVVTQDLKSRGTAAGDTLPLGASKRGWGWDFGGKLDYGPAELVAYGYLGEGIGTTGLFFDAVSPGGQKRSSNGYYIQGSYIFIKKLTFSASYGLSHLDSGSGEFSPLLVKDNESYALGLKYGLTSWVNLIGEFTHTTATAHGGNRAEDDTFAIGAITFF